MAVLLQIALISAISLICGDILLVLGSLEISFEDVGSFEYNGEKAYMEGDHVKLNCDVYDAQQLLQNRVLVYTKDGMKLTSNQQLLVPNLDNHYLIQHNILLDIREQYNLFINGVTKEDQGDYQCSVHVGDHEGAIVETARWTQMVPGGRTTPQITVLYLPDVNRYPECVVDEGTVDVKLGSTLTLKCNSEYGNPSVNLEWKRNNGVDPDPRNQISVSSTMSTSDEEMTYITKVTISAEYSGVVFYCYMTPSLNYFPGDLRSCQVGPINIIDSDATLPTITPLVQVAEPGDTVNFQCDLADDTQAEFQWSWDPPRWTFEKQPVSPDTRIFTFRNVRSYHHLTKIFCKTFSQGVQVSAYGLIRVNADQYEEPPSLPPDGDDSTGGQQGGGQNGGQNPSRTEAPDTTRTTKTSAAGGVRIQSMTASARFGKLLVIVGISFLVTLF